jgi:translation initiation factor IF-2
MLKHIPSQIFDRNPIIAAFKVEEGHVRVGQTLRNSRGEIVGTVEKILAGTIVHGHYYTEYAQKGMEVSVLIRAENNIILIDYETLFVVGK